MKLYLHGQPFADGPCVAALGMFDGVHTGHRLVLSRALLLARREGLPLAVISFERHPLCALQPGDEPELLTTNSEKACILHKLGVNSLVLLRFDEGMSRLRPEEYLAFLKEKYAVKTLVVGENHRFGASGAGNARNICGLAAPFGMRAVIVPVRDRDGKKVSSTGIRRMLKDGDPVCAREMLGYPYTLRGRIVHGQGLGHSFGFPTINVRVPANKLLPRYGVYGAIVLLNGKRYRAVCNIGVRPTLGGEAPSVEAFLLDFSGDVYGESAAVSLADYYRPEMRFSSIDELSRQVMRDIDRARSQLPVAAECEG